MKRRDLILIILLLVIAGGAYGIMQQLSSKGGYVVVTVNSETVYTCNLSEDQTYDIPLDKGENTIVVKDGKVYMDHADCPDQICVDHKPINTTDESIVCLPHRVVVSVEEGEASDVDMMVK